MCVCARTRGCVCGVGVVCMQEQGEAQDLKHVSCFRLCVISSTQVNSGRSPSRPRALCLQVGLGPASLPLMLESKHADKQEAAETPDSVRCSEEEEVAEL